MEANPFTIMFYPSNKSNLIFSILMKSASDSGSGENRTTILVPNDMRRKH